MFIVCEVLIVVVSVAAGDKAEIEKIVQAAWTFVNDRYTHSLTS